MLGYLTDGTWLASNWLAAADAAIDSTDQQMALEPRQDSSTADFCSLPN